MCEQGALRLAGRAGRVDQEQRVRVRSVTSSHRVTCRLERGPHTRELERGLPELAVLVLDQEQRRLGVVQLERDLGRPEAPPDWIEDLACLRAREHQRNVLAGVAGER